MKIYGKKSLCLKEMTFKKSDLILKEDDKVHLTDVSGMVDGLNKDGDVTATNQVDRQTVDVPILTKNNQITTNDLKSSEPLQSAINMAKTHPVDVEVTASKVNGTVTPISNTSNKTNTVSEGIRLTKKEMNNYLKNL